MSLTISLPIPQLKKKKSQQVDVFDVPKIEHQAELKGWAAGIYNFRKGQKPDEDFFNPGLVEHSGKRWLLVRRSKRIAELAIGLNDIVAFTLENNQPMTGWPLKIPKIHPNFHWEDCRGAHYNGRTVVAGCAFYMVNNKSWSGAHVTAGIFGTPDSQNGFGKLLGTQDWDYGGNGAHINAKGRKPTKNLLPFFHEGRLHVVHWGSPHIIYEVDEKGKVVQDFNSPNTMQSMWKYGEVRGGTPPVLHDGLYWTFFHSSIPWMGDRRQFHAGLYAFEPTPPFKVVKMTTEPLLSGSRFDLWFSGKPLVCFPVGALLEKNGDWLVTYGVNDLQSGYCRIPHEALSKSLVTI